MATLVKFGSNVAVKEGGNAVSGWLVQFDKVDVDGQYFTKDTDFGTDRDQISLPIMYRHGKSKKAKKTRYGELHITRKETGLWAEGTVDASKKYAKEILGLAASGTLGWSSGSSEHCTDFVKTAKGERIDAWFLIEGSLTPNPAEPSNNAFVKSTDDFDGTDDLLDDPLLFAKEETETTEGEKSDGDEKTETAVKEAAAIGDEAVKMYTPYSMPDAFYTFGALFYYPPSFLNLTTIAARVRDLAKFIEAGNTDNFETWTMDGETYKKFAAIFKEASELNENHLKGGRRNSSSDQKNLNAAHQAIVKAGATCDETTTKESVFASSDDETAALKETIAKIETKLNAEIELRKDAEAQVKQLQGFLNS